MFGGFLALAAPANAETSRYGCTDDPLDPKVQYHNQYHNRVDFDIKADCNGEKTVEIRQRIYEDDRGSRRHDDLLIERTVRADFDRRDDARTLDYCVDFGDDHGRHDYAMHKSDCDDVDNHHRKVEEVYQLVSFRVQNHGGHWSDWTDWEKSAVVEVDHHGH